VIAVELVEQRRGGLFGLGKIDCSVMVGVERAGNSGGRDNGRRRKGQPGGKREKR
jgi:hypothetical protein